MQHYVDIVSRKSADMILDNFDKNYSSQHEWKKSLMVIFNYTQIMQSIVSVGNMLDHIYINH